MSYEVSENRYKPLLENVQEYFTKANQSIWDKRNKIKIIPFLNEEIAVKSFKIPHSINKIAYTLFRPSKARRSYENSIRIRAFVPKPIGYREFKKWGLLHESYFLSEKYAYDFTIREVLTDTSFRDKQNIFIQFVAFTHALHQENVHHLDYSPGNILIKKCATGTYEFKVVDVNRMQFQSLSKQARIESFSKLWASDEDLTQIVQAYAKLSDIEVSEAVNIALLASQRHKKRKNFKKRLKGKKVVD